MAGGPKTTLLLTCCIVCAAYIHSESTAESLDSGRSLLQRWLSPECQDFYADNELCSRLWNWTSPLPELERRGKMKAVQRQTCSLEDLSAKGREMERRGHGPNLKHPMLQRKMMVNEVTLSHKYKFIYVSVRKAGSSSVGNVLRKLFHATVLKRSSCPGAPLYELRLNRRCTSLVVNETMWRDFFVFTFVRDPIERFWSSASQSNANRRLKVQHKDCTVVRRNLVNLLTGMKEQARSPESHWETQTFSLSTAVVLRGAVGMLDFDFIGDVARFSSSLPSLLARIEENAGKRLPVTAKLAALKEAKNPSGSTIKRCRTEEIDRLVREVYEHDVACFGGSRDRWHDGEGHTAKRGQGNDTSPAESTRNGPRRLGGGPRRKRKGKHRRRGRAQRQS